MSDLLTTPFGFDPTKAQVISGVGLTGRTAIVTGASSGIGVESPRALASADASVTLAVRDPAAGEKAPNVLFAVEATRRWADDGITSNALIPGAIFDTALGCHVGAGHAAAAATHLKLKTVEQRAATSVTPGAGGGARYALDPANCERLCDVSLGMAA